MVSIMRVFFNYKLETSNKFDRKAEFSDRDLTNVCQYMIMSNTILLLLYSIIYLTIYHQDNGC
jgi:hypothetical protein